jgi:hypothetical protein
MDTDWGQGQALRVWIGRVWALGYDVGSRWGMETGIEMVD